MSGHYTTQIRLLACQACGGPIEAPTSGGSVACTYCRAQNAFQIRSAPIDLHPPDEAPIDEAARLALLRTQAGTQTPLHPSMLRIITPDGRLDPVKIQEAFQVFAATRTECETTSSPDAAERLYSLTIVLENHLIQTDEPRRRRAVLETAVETLTLPRHLQIIRCQLAKAAAYEGDLAAADEWLRPCDGRSRDLSMDTAYRSTRALLDTYRGGFESVLELLGTDHATIPLHPQAAYVGSLLRANAHEKLGRVDVAAELMRGLILRENAQGRTAIKTAMKRLDTIDVCRQSYPAALDRIRGRPKRKSPPTDWKQVGGFFGAGLKWSGLAVLVAGLLVIGFGIVPTIIELIVEQGELNLSTFVSSVFTLAVGVVGCVVAGLGAVLAYAGLRVQKKNARPPVEKPSAPLPELGPYLEVVGVVQNIETAMYSLNGQSVYFVRFRIEPPGAEPYEVRLDSTESDLPPHAKNVGAKVNLLVHPEERTNVRFDVI